jgi:hypothetical protein
MHRFGVRRFRLLVQGLDLPTGHTLDCVRKTATKSAWHTIKAVWRFGTDGKQKVYPVVSNMLPIILRKTSIRTYLGLLG